MFGGCLWGIWELTSPSLRTNPPPAHGGFGPDSCLYNLTLFFWPWLVWPEFDNWPKLHQSGFLPREFGIKKYNVILLRAWTGWSQKPVHGVAIFCHRNRKVRKPAFWKKQMKWLAENQNENRWPERERETESMFIFPWRLFSVLSLFFNLLKPSPHLPTPDATPVYSYHQIYKSFGIWTHLSFLSSSPIKSRSSTYELNSFPSS